MSARKRITEEVVKRTTAGVAVRFLRDDHLIGFGLRVTPNGAKSFIVEGRVNGRMRQFTVGPVERFSVNEANSGLGRCLRRCMTGKTRS